MGQNRASYFSLLFLILAACSSSSNPRGDVNGLEEIGSLQETFEVESWEAEDAETLEPHDHEGGLEPTGLARYVNPFVGTGGKGFDIGSAFPGATLPFGLAKPGPDTTGEFEPPPQFHCSGYYYGDHYIRGISQIHVHGTGAVDYGALSVVPLMDKKGFFEGFRQSFSHDNENAFPGYYSVTLDNRIKIELTATQHCAVHRYTWPDDSRSLVGIDFGYTLPNCSVTNVEISGPKGKEIKGVLHYNGALSGRDGGFDLYFDILFSSSFVVIADEGSQKDKEVLRRMVLRFPNAKEVEVRVGLSMTDQEGARKNLKECRDRSFDEIVQDALDIWNSYLGKVEVDADESTKRVFYTSLYHALLMPDLLSDADERYRGFDGKVHEGKFFSDFSMWDTFRTVHPLLSLLYPDIEGEMVHSLLLIQEEGGFLPRWPIAHGYSNSMFGTPSDVVVTDSLLRGVRVENTKEFLDGMVRVANGAKGNGFSGRDGAQDYVSLGYVPADLHNGSVSRTVEFSLDDYCISKLAQAIGDHKTAETFAKRASNWKNLYDPSTGFFVPRNKDGTFLKGLDPKAFEWKHAYIEGTAWHYLFDLPHATKELADLMGRDTFFEKLKQFFKNAEIGRNVLPDSYYWHGNEPALYSPFMFSELGDYGSTSKWVGLIRQNCYADQAEGLAGNDDAGTLGAWYVFAAIGIFPRLCKGDYVLFEPGVRSAVLHLAGGDLFIKKGNSLRFNNTPISSNIISHSLIKNGGVLELPEVK